MPVSRHTLSRFGPSHCGQSSAQTEAPSREIVKRPNEPRTKVFIALVLGNRSKENRARTGSFFNQGRPRPYGFFIKRVYRARMWDVSRGRVGSVTDHTCRSDATISAHAGARPITSRDRLQSRLHAPLEPRCRQKPLNIGLWDEWP